MTGYRPDIDGLRAVAVLAVVLFHAGLPVASGGYVGVDVFFVISGYLITRILGEDLARGRVSLFGFYERRARRILPVLIAVILACFVAGWLLLMPSRMLHLGESAAATALFFSNIWFWKNTGGYFDDAADYEPLLHTWSLAVEEQFYIVFPLLLWALAGWRPGPRRWLIAALTLGSLLLAVVLTRLDQPVAFYLAPTRAWELGLGILLALEAVPPPPRRWMAGAAAAAGLAAILAAVTLYGRDTQFPGLAALPPCLGAAAIIWAGDRDRTLTSAALSLRPVIFVGLISYSLYLWHWPILAFLRLHLRTVELPAAVAVAAVAAALALAVLSWACIERPFRRRPPAGPTRRAVFQAAAAGLAAVLALSLGVWWTDGLEFRMPPEVRKALAGAEDFPNDRRGCFGLTDPAEMCVFGAAAPDDGADLLLWGDSHALALLPGVEAAAGAAGKSGRFAGKSGCAPLLGLDRGDREGDNSGCASFNAGILAMLGNRDDMALVILSGRWALAAEGSRLPGELGASAVLARAGAPGGDPAGNFALFAPALENTVGAILATGRQVLLVTDIPEFGWSVPDRLAEHLRYGTPLPGLPTLDDVTSRNRRVDQVLAPLDTRPGVAVLRIAPALCEPECRISRDGKPLFRDDDHLSASGAIAIVAPLLKESLLP